jgi:hypothetical protein
MNGPNANYHLRDETVHFMIRSNTARRLFLPCWVLLCAVSAMATAQSGEDAEPPVSLGLQVEDKSDAESRFQAAGIPSLAARKCVVISTVDPSGPCAGLLNANTAVTSVGGMPTPDIAAYEIAIKAIKADAVVEVKGLYLAPSPQGKQRWQSGSTKIRLDNAMGMQNAIAAGGKPSQDSPETIASNNPPDPTNDHLLIAEEVSSVIAVPDRIRELVGFPAKDAVVKWEGLLADAQIEFSLCDSRVGDRSYVCQLTGEEGEVTIWNAKTGSRLRVANAKVSKVYAPLAFSPNQMLLCSLDGSYVRVWRIEKDNTLSLYGSTTVPDMNGGSGEDFAATWADDDHIIVYSAETRGDIRLFNLKDGALTFARTLGKLDPRGHDANEARAMTWGNGGKAVLMISNGNTAYGGYFLRAFTVLDSKTTGEIPFTGGLVAALPLDPCLFYKRPKLRDMHIMRDSKLALISTWTDTPDDEKRYRQIVISDAATLKPQGMFTLRGNDTIVAVSRDEKFAIVLRVIAAKSKTEEEVTYAAMVYDLRTGRRLAAFSLGEEFTVTRDLRDGGGMMSPQLHFTEDAKHVLAIGCVGRDVPGVAGEESNAGTVSLVLGKWRVEDGVRERLLTRRESNHGNQSRRMSQMVGLWLGQDGLAICSVPGAAKPEKWGSQVINVLRIEDLFRVADLIREGDELVGKKDLKAAAGRYQEAIASGNDWWFKDQYPHLLNACFDYKAFVGDRLAAKEIALWLKEQKVSISPTSKEGSQVLASLEAEEQASVEAAKKEAEVAAQMRQDRLAEFRKENRDRFVPSKNLTRNEFIQKLDAVKSNGVIGIGGVTNLQFVNHAFQDAIRDPAKMVTLEPGKVEMGFECRDGWVWLSVTAVPAQGITVVTSMDLR